MDRLAPWAALVALVALMVAPALSDPPVDGFPLSTYPMFAVDRGKQATIATAVGLTASGEVERLSPALLAGADEPILAVRTAELMVRSDAAAGWCIEVAARVAQAGHKHAELLVVQVRQETHNVVATVVDGAEPLAIQVHAECRVGRR